MSTILLIPPNGVLKRQDFSLQRLATWLQDIPTIKTTLLYIPNEITLNKTLFDNVIEVPTQDILIHKIEQLSYAYIFHRSWMHAYSFAATLTTKFGNVIVNIKDWNFASKEQYHQLFGNDDDFNAIEIIFKNAAKVLSHYTDEQAKIWSQQYNVDVNKFVFFPELCNANVLQNQKRVLQQTISLVYAGKIPPSTLPNAYFPTQSHLRSIKILTQHNITIDFVIPEDEYLNMMKYSDKFEEVFDLSHQTQNFNIKKGEALNPNILSNYNYGFFELEACGDNEMLYRYAITSKFAFYLEAGLPLLVNEKFKAIAQLVKQHQLGIIFSNSDLPNLHTNIRISDSQYQQIIKNIHKFRKSFTYNSHYLKHLFPNGELSTT